MSDLVPALTIAAAVSSALLTGVLFAFSTSVMPALASRPPAEGMAAMQAMNRTIMNPLFGLVFGGSALLCLVVAATAPFTTDEAGWGWRLAGGALYVIGVTLETMAMNVPMNDRLDAADPATADGQRGLGGVPATVDPMESTSGRSWAPSPLSCSPSRSSCDPTGRGARAGVRGSGGRGSVRRRGRRHRRARSGDRRRRVPLRGQLGAAGVPPQLHADGRRRRGPGRGRLVRRRAARRDRTGRRCRLARPAHRRIGPERRRRRRVVRGVFAAAPDALLQATDAEHPASDPAVSVQVEVCGGEGEAAADRIDAVVAPILDRFDMERLLATG